MKNTGKKPPASSRRGGSNRRKSGGGSKGKRGDNWTLKEQLAIAAILALPMVTLGIIITLVMSKSCGREEAQGKKVVEVVVQAEDETGERVWYYLPITGGSNIRITSPYRASEKFRGGREHLGIDLATDDTASEKVRAFARGRVTHITRAGTDKYNGNGVWLKHPCGLETVYIHMASIVRGLQVGDEVGGGAILGRPGDTGRVHTKGVAHLHFEVRRDGRHYDPETVIRQLTGFNLVRKGEQNERITSNGKRN